MDVAITDELLGRLAPFGGPFYETLKKHQGERVDYRDVALLYLDSLARHHNKGRGFELGAIYFVDQIRRRAGEDHLIWFGRLAEGPLGLEVMCDELQQMVDKEPGYAYEYYRAACKDRHSDDGIRPELKAQFDPLLPPPTKRIEEEPSSTTNVVYFWSPPSL